jgi:protein-disulfide isomerase
MDIADEVPSSPVSTQPATGPTPVAIAPSETALILGDPDAPVTIVEYSDYQCPFCAQYTSETWPRLKAEFVDTGRVRYVFKDFPLTNIHPQAPKAHEAARCAGEQGAYWAMHDRLFAGQAEWVGDPNHVGVLKGYATDLGLDATAFDACLAGGRWAESVKADLTEGVGLGVRGTPSFFIDGYPLVGAQPYETFQYAIELAEQGRLGEAYQPAPQQ